MSSMKPGPEKNERPEERSTSDPDAGGNPVATPVAKGPDVYDPVGMAGKKAGIVEDLSAAVDQASSEERPTHTHALRKGAAGFHGPEPDEQAARGDGIAPASLVSDRDPDRADTGTGDQPGNTGGSRTGTPPEPSLNP